MPVVFATKNKELKKNCQGFPYKRNWRRIWAKSWVCFQILPITIKILKIQEEMISSQTNKQILNGPNEFEQSSTWRINHQMNNWMKLPRKICEKSLGWVTSYMGKNLIDHFYFLTLRIEAFSQSKNSSKFIPNFWPKGSFKLGFGDRLNISWTRLFLYMQFSGHVHKTFQLSFFEKILVHI